MLALAAAVMLLAAPPVDDAFKSWFDEKAVAVSKAKEDGKTFPWIRGTAELDATPAEVAAILADYSAYKKTFDPVLQSVKVLEIEGTTTRLHLEWPYPWPLSDRDAIVAYTLETEADARCASRGKPARRRATRRRSACGSTPSKGARSSRRWTAAARA